MCQIHLLHNMISGQYKGIVNPSSTIYKFIKEILSEVSQTQEDYIDLQSTNKRTSKLAYVCRRKLCIEIFRLAFEKKNMDMLQIQ